MNDRPSSSSPGDAGIAPAPAAAEGWGAMLQDSNGPAGPDTIQHHDQSPFVTHNSNRNNGSSQYHHHHHHHHHQNNLLYHHHQQPPHFMKGAMVNGLSGGDEPSQQHFHHHHEAESDADEEVRSLDLPAQVGIDLRSKRVGSTEALDRERPMSWEGELSDQEVSQMDQELAAASSTCPTESTSQATGGPSPPQQPPPPLPAQSVMATLKTEPIHEEEAEEELDEDEHEMEGIQSAGPGSPQPMCTNAGDETLRPDGNVGQHPQHHAMPPPSSLSFHHHHAQHQHHAAAPPAEIKTELPWNAECGPKAESVAGVRPSPPLTSSAAPAAVTSSFNTTTATASNSGFTPSAVPRPTFGEAFTGHTPLASPLTNRHPIRLPLSAASGLPHPPTPSPDSAIHSAYYSPTASPGQSRHRSGSGLSSPYSHRASPSLSRNNSDASQYSVHSQYGGSQYSYSSAPSPLSPSPAQSPVQPRHMAMLSAAGYGLPGRSGGGLAGNGEFPPSPLLYRHGLPAPFPGATPAGSLPGVRDLEIKTEPAGAAGHPPGLSTTDTNDDSREGSGEEKSLNPSDLAQHTASLAAQAGISRQQLINSPCPICGDKISGFHYGIFSCESCKGFFKRTVQNKKNYVCLRGAACPVTIATRKKCPACRFEKCLNTGMKLEAIREDRTRGGRSTYQCTYAVPSGSSGTPTGVAGGDSSVGGSSSNGGGKLLLTPNGDSSSSRSMDSSEWSSSPPSATPGGGHHHHNHHGHHNPHLLHHQHPHHPSNTSAAVPQLLLEIMNVEHLWHCNESDGSAQQHRSSTASSSSSSSSRATSNKAGADSGSNHNHGGTAAEGDSVSSLCSIADHRLYKIVKWCKSLPLFKNIQIDDQISLLINTWCELLLFACCFRSVATPGEIRISHGKSITLEQARALGLSSCIERMIHFTDHLRRLRVDQFEYAAMKVIILLSSDTSGLKESESVRSSQESVLKALQQYTLSHYPDVPSKFGELLLRIPELERTCQVGKDMLTVKREGDGQGFNLLMELLRGDH